MRVYKRGDRWYVSEIKDGKNCRRSLGPDVRTKAQALRVAKGHVLEPEQPKMTLRAFFKDFIINARIRLASSSVKRYEYSFKAFMYDIGDFFPVEKVTNQLVNKWAASLLDKGRSPEGINLDLRHIRAALKRGEDIGIIFLAPKIDMVKTSKRLPRHLSEKQFQAILSAEPREDFKKLWSFMVWTGVRRFEAFNLAWTDVIKDGDNWSMRVVGKGDRERVVPLLAPAIKAMGPEKLSGRVFNLGSLDNWTAHFKKTARLAGVPGARLHDLRHTCLTVLVGHGVPLKLVQDIAGHSTINTTMNYAKIFTGNAHKVLNSMLGF